MTRREILQRLLREARPYYGRMAVALVLGVVAGLTPLTLPWAFGRIENAVLAATHPDVGVLYQVLALTFLALTAGAVTTYGQTYLTAWSGQHLVASLRVRLFARTLHLPLGEFDKWRPGELISRFTYDLQLMTDAVSVSLPQLFVVIVTFVGAIARMIAIDWLLTVSLFVVAPVVSYAVAVFNRLISSGTLRAQSRIANLSSTLTEVLHGQRIVKAFGREDHEIERFRERNNDYFGTYMKLTQFIQTQPLIVSELVLIGILGIVWLSAREVLAGRLNSGLVIQYWTLIVLVINPMNRFAAFVGEISKALVGAGRVFEVLDLRTEPADRADAVSLPEHAGTLVFDDVTFSYHPQEGPVLRDFNARIEAGEIVALVGPSGAGKTTIVNLVPRFYEPQSGRVFLDGIELDRLRLTELRGAIAIVPQETQLFRATIAENIRYGRLNATDDEVRAAAREANAEEFVSAFPAGYETEVGERGVRLSGGQRQRIAIARAILRDPRILILDEATSALDSHSETLIEEALDRLLPGRTTLIIAHRLATIRRASRILYIEAGRVRETGTHDALLAAGGPYARLHAAQYA